MEHTELTPGQRVRFANSGVGTDQLGTYQGTDDEGICLVTWDARPSITRRVIRANLFRVFGADSDPFAHYYTDDGPTCIGCGRHMQILSVFPGTNCIKCHAESPEGRRMPTASEVRSMWGM